MMALFSFQRLNGDRRAAMVAHFLALPPKDRSLRFGMALAPSVIAAYADRIDFDRDVVFGAHDRERMLIGVAHVALGADRAEVALSVLPEHRCLGVATALFKRAVAHARIRRVPRLFMQCLWGNIPIIRIARRFGMRIVAGDGNAEANLQLRPVTVE
jgi:GNAT superfamily N-acetyltransferase